MLQVMRCLELNLKFETTYAIVVLVPRQHERSNVDILVYKSSSRLVSFNSNDNSKGHMIQILGWRLSFRTIAQRTHYYSLSVKLPKIRMSTAEECMSLNSVHF
jgi:hypothetical protein